MATVEENELLSRIAAALERQDASTIHYLLEHWPPPIAASVLQQFSVWKIRSMLFLVKSPGRTAIFSELPAKLRYHLLIGLSDKDIIEWLEPFLPGELGYHLLALPQQRRDRIEDLMARRGEETYPYPTTSVRFFQNLRSLWNRSRK